MFLSHDSAKLRDCVKIMEIFNLAMVPKTFVMAGFVSKIKFLQWRDLAYEKAC